MRFGQEAAGSDRNWRWYAAGWLLVLWGNRPAPGDAQEQGEFDRIVAEAAEKYGGIQRADAAVAKRGPSPRRIWRLSFADYQAVCRERFGQSWRVLSRKAWLKSQPYQSGNGSLRIFFSRDGLAQAVEIEHDGTTHVSRLDADLVRRVQAVIGQKATVFECLQQFLERRWQQGGVVLHAKDLAKGLRADASREVAIDGGQAR